MSAAPAPTGDGAFGRSAEDKQKNLTVLETTRRARHAFETSVRDASRDKDPELIAVLQQDKMYEFAEFFFAIDAMDLTGPDDIGILADLHNQRVVDLLKDKPALRRRGLRADPLLKSIITSDMRPRLEEIWRAAPGSLDQSNLGRFLVTQMSEEKVRSLVIAATKAGFLTRVSHPRNVMVVCSTGVMERLLNDSLRDLRLDIAKL